ncbi:hypothetical protein FQR65_LT18439 [Abscondita terminalis]|nr:hypothetical protein FQR65_LT18439 [Abscondita terminalis]
MDQDTTVRTNRREKVVITCSVTKRDNGKRIRDKRHCCFICNKILTNNMARHFEVVHSKDIDVSKILSLPKNSKPRREQFEHLLRCGDFYHNLNVLAVKQGELILVRRPDENGHFTYEDFAPCTHCLGFMQKKYLWCHVKKCKKQLAKTDSSTMYRRGHLQESSAVMFEILGPKVDDQFRKEIINTFKVDNISNVCKEDTLILALGAFLFDKYGGVQVELIRQNMRQLARLKIQLLREEDSAPTLSSLITPANFNKIVQATKIVCGNDATHLEKQKRNDFDTPSLALKIGHLLRKCVAIESGRALRKGDTTRHSELKNFMELMDLEWSVRISSKALVSMHKKKISSTQLLPLTSDLMKLNKYLNDKINLLKVLILSNCNRKIWSDFASVVLCRVILFNKRRSGEAARMTMENFNLRPSWSQQCTEEFKNSLSPLETKLANELTVVNIIGKRNRIVPVLLTEDMKSFIELLIELRPKGSISPDNPYVFARSEASKLNLPVRGSDCLREACRNASLTSAENINGTKLRKYIATVCQVFNLKENECDWLARHLGHDIRVHRDFYRMHESAIELTKVSRLLLAVDRGEVAKFAGKDLNDINIEDLPALEIEDDNLDNVGEEQSADIALATNESIVEETINDPKTSVNKLTRKTCIKRSWSSEETACLLKHFSAIIKQNGPPPGKKQCEDCITKFKVLETRKWTDIKYYIKNHISKIKKAKSNSNL